MRTCLAKDPGERWQTAHDLLLALKWIAEGGGPGASDFSLYPVSYVQPADGIERVVNGDFSAGNQSWALSGQAQLVPSDHGPGQMVLVQANSTESAWLTSAPFSVTSGSEFQLTYSARVAPSSAGSGYFMVIFLSGGTEFLRNTIGIAAGKVPLGPVTTDPAGHFQFSLGLLGTTQVTLEATYAGDSQHWPAYAHATP